MSLVGRKVESLRGRGLGADADVDQECDCETGKRAARRPDAGLVVGVSSPSSFESSSSPVGCGALAVDEDEREELDPDFTEAERDADADGVGVATEEGVPETTGEAIATAAEDEYAEAAARCGHRPRKPCGAARTVAEPRAKIVTTDWKNNIFLKKT